MGEIGELAEDAHESTWLDHAVRLGLVAYGVVHLLVAWLAGQLALGSAERSASSSGALHEIAAGPFGHVLLWLIPLGLVLLVVWRLLEATVGHTDEDGASLWRKRAASLLKAALYGVLAVSTLKVALGDGSRGGTDSATARLLALPFGQVLVAAIGVSIAGYGVAQVWRAFTESFREHLDHEGRSGAAGTAYLWFGKCGYTAKGVALAVVGGLFVWAALADRATRSGGLDVALRTVREQPFGRWLLGLIAVGIACYGLFCLARARHLSRD